MKNKFLTLLVMFFGLSFGDVWAQNVADDEKIVDVNYDAKKKVYDIAKSRETKFQLYADYGARVDQVNWNIASDLSGNNTPNVLSELTWRKLKITQTQIGGYIPLLKTHIGEVPGELMVHGYYSKGNVNSGENQDSDYDGDNRTGEFSRSYSKTKGTVTDFSVDLRYRVPIFVDRDNYFITPLFGYSQSRQNLTDYDGYQSIPNTGAFSGVNAISKFKWSGPFVGVNFEVYAGKRNKFELTGEYHAVNYNVTADWVLRDDLQHPQSFKQKASGSGAVLDLKYKFKVMENLSLGLVGSLRNFQVSNGTITFYNADGTVGQQKLNDANWSSKSLMAEIALNF
jgi:hypothetical protein